MNSQQVATTESYASASIGAGLGAALPLVVSSLVIVLVVGLSAPLRDDDDKAEVDTFEGDWNRLRVLVDRLSSKMRCISSRLREALRRDRDR